MEDIQFSTRNHRNRHLYSNGWENRNRGDWVSSPLNDSQNPIDILREAFIKYIVETPIESNTISIEIHYLQRNENQSEENVERMLIVKYQYGNTPDLYTQISGQRNTFNNSKLDSLLETLEDKRIIMISLCEVYNNDPVSRRRFFRQFEISNNRSTLYIQQLVAKHVQNMKIVNQDEAFGVKIANAYVKCQSYTEGLVRLKFQTKPSEFSDKAVTYIAENLSQKLTSTENLIGVMQISGLHWKHKEKMREKVTVESFKK
jgi:hypothetical protein